MSKKELTPEQQRYIDQIEELQFQLSNLPMWDIHGFSTEDARIDIENDILYLNHELEQLMDANN